VYSPHIESDSYLEQRVIESFSTDQARRELAAEILKMNMIFALVCKIQGAYSAPVIQVNYGYLLVDTGYRDSTIYEQSHEGWFRG